MVWKNGIKTTFCGFVCAKSCNVRQSEALQLTVRQEDRVNLLGAALLCHRYSDILELKFTVQIRTAGGIMTWTAPAFEVICLNCEINSYASAKL